mgnify:FL=1
MKAKRKSLSIVEESDLGVYVWITEDGKIVADEHGNYFNIPSKKHDPKQLSNFKHAVKDLGIEGGRPVFLSGHRRVTDEEYEYQRQRLEWGLIPDELDLPAFKEEYKNKKVRDAQGIRLTDWRRW